MVSLVLTGGAVLRFGTDRMLAAPCGRSWTVSGGGRRVLSYEHVFVCDVGMTTALASLDRLIADLAAVDADLMDVDELGVLAIGLGRGIDRLTGFHAKLVHAADERRVWDGTGARDVEDWLSGRTGTSRRTAQSRQQLGEAFEKAPELEDAVDAGELSAEAAGALHDAIVNPPAGADADDVAELIDAAKGSGPRDAKATAERWREVHSAETVEERTARRYAKRSVTSRPASDGLVETTVVLPELEHRQVMNALGRAAGGFTEGDDRTVAQRLADGLINLTSAYAKGTVTGGREKPTLLIGCSADTLAGLSDEPGWTGHGDRIPADVVRHLAETAILRRVVIAGNAIVDLGNRVRCVTDDQYQALLMRDGGCRYPGCTVPAAWCEADHLIAVTDGGLTDLVNLALWCPYHHRFKHRSDVTVIGDAHHLSVQLPDGRRIHCPPRGLPTRHTPPQPTAPPAPPAPPPRRTPAAA